MMHRSAKLSTWLITGMNQNDRGSFTNLRERRLMLQVTWQIYIHCGVRKQRHTIRPFIRPSLRNIDIVPLLTPGTDAGYYITYLPFKAHWEYMEAYPAQSTNLSLSNWLDEAVALHTNPTHISYIIYNIYSIYIHIYLYLLFGRESMTWVRAAIGLFSAKMCVNQCLPLRPLTHIEGCMC